MQKITRWFFIILGFFFVAIGWIGVVIPGLPTVPFLIVALACFAKGSKRFHTWLYNHRIFGYQLQLWQKYNVIPITAKIAATSSMLVSILYMILFSKVSLFVIIITSVFMLIGAVYVLSKPSYPPKG